MKSLLSLLVAAGAITVSNVAMADWYFRGTPNNWGAVPMQQLDSQQYRTCQQFQGGTSAAFKIDKLADWSESYPSSNYSVSNNAHYQIDFNASTKAITTTAVADCGYKRVFSSLHFRGTANSWAATPMVLLEDNVWATNIYFDGQANQRFKVDVKGDWSDNYGDTGADGNIEAFGADIYTTVTGNYRLEVNDASKTWRLVQLDGRQGKILGAEYSPSATTFAIWSPDTSNVKVTVNGQSYTLSKAADYDGYTDVYQVTVPGDLHLKTYEFFINNKSVRDPYGKMVIPNTNTNIVMDMSRTSPSGGWAGRPPLNEREDAVVYEVHVRDFTIDASSGVSSANRGKYAGMTQSGTQYQGVSTGFDHLKELGVTHVQLLPVYDFATCADPADETCYNWGYDPRNYNIPEERYSKTPYDYVNRVNEFKTMINEFHKAGIRVIMDVVYNHTYANEMFEDITMQYFWHQDLVVGNTVDGNNPMVSRMIQESLEYWVREYNIDGFRFDLIGIFDFDDVQKWGKHLNETFPDRQLVLYGEPWPGCFNCTDEREQYRTRLGTIGKIQDSHVGVFNPKFREAIKGSNDNGGCNPGDCYAFNQGSLWPINVGSRGSIRASNDASIQLDTWDAMFAMDPEQSVNYVSAHDNLTLRDKIVEWADLNGVSHSSTYLDRIQKFANGIVLTSQGIAFIHGGAEMMRHKQGEHNSYNLPDSINKYRWQWKVDHLDVFNYYKDAIALRNAHPALRLNSWDEINQHVTTTEPRYGVVVNHIKNRANNDSWSEIIVIYNSADNYTHALPSGSWKVAMEKADATAGNGRTVSGSVVAEGTAVTVIYKE